MKKNDVFSAVSLVCIAAFFISLCIQGSRIKDVESAYQEHVFNVKDDHCALGKRKSHDAIDGIVSDLGERLKVFEKHIILDGDKLSIWSPKALRLKKIDDEIEVLENQRMAIESGEIFYAPDENLMLGYGHLFKIDHGTTCVQMGH